MVSIGNYEQNTPQAKIAYKGESEEYKKTNTELYVIFALALITAYLAMSAQFESWRHPLTGASDSRRGKRCI